MRDRYAVKRTTEPMLPFERWSVVELEWLGRYGGDRDVSSWPTKRMALAACRRLEKRLSQPEVTTSVGAPLSDLRERGDST